MNLRVPNGVFQMVFFRFLTSACDRGKPLQMDKECLKTPVFLSILVPSALGDADHPLNARLWKTPFRKHRLLLLGWNFPSHTQTLENVARKISPKFHAKFHDTFGREKRRKNSLPHFCRVAALRNMHLKNSDLWESRLQFSNSEPRNFTKQIFGDFLMYCRDQNYSRSVKMLPGVHFVGKRNHTPPCSSAELFFV